MLSEVVRPRKSEPTYDRKPAVRRKKTAGKKFGLKRKQEQNDLIVRKTVSSSELRKRSDRLEDSVGPISTSLSRHHSEPIKLPPLLPLRSLPLPRTTAPHFHATYPLKARFHDMSSTLTRIPSDDWLASVLFAAPVFSHVLERNLQKVKSRLSKAPTSVILEEDTDSEERLGETAYF